METRTDTTRSEPDFTIMNTDPVTPDDLPATPAPPTDPTTNTSRAYKPYLPYSNR
jgi:hypothetical protein